MAGQCVLVGKQGTCECKQTRARRAVHVTIPNTRQTRALSRVALAHLVFTTDDQRRTTQQRLQPWTTLLRLLSQQAQVLEASTLDHQEWKPRRALSTRMRGTGR